MLFSSKLNFNMTDIVDSATRSRMMSGIRSKNTKPELLVRKSLHRLGYRFRLHRKDLPGSPDIVLPKYRVVIFVHGCFWHGHDCKYFRWPASREEFWRDKISLNKKRDQIALKKLSSAGWKVALVWECSLKDDVKKEFFSDLSAWVKDEGSSFIEVSGEGIWYRGIWQ